LSHGKEKATFQITVSRGATQQVGGSTINGKFVPSFSRLTAQTDQPDPDYGFVSDANDALSALGEGGTKQVLATDPPYPGDAQIPPFPVGSKRQAVTFNQTFTWNMAKQRGFNWVRGDVETIFPSKN
jgi:hypothetical protein